MPAHCNPDLFDFAPVEDRSVVAAFDGGTMTSDAGALLLGATDRAVGLIDRLAACFVDHRDRTLIEHELRTLVGQRVLGIALGYEDLIDHDTLRHDPVMAVLAGKLQAKRRDCAPLAGKSTLNRLELSTAQPGPYHKIGHRPAAVVLRRHDVDGHLGKNRHGFPAPTIASRHSYQDTGKKSTISGNSLAELAKGRSTNPPCLAMRRVRCRGSLGEQGLWLIGDFSYPSGVADFCGPGVGEEAGSAIFTPRPAMGRPCPVGALRGASRCPGRIG